MTFSLAVVLAWISGARLRSSRTIRAATGIAGPSPEEIAETPGGPYRADGCHRRRGFCQALGMVRGPSDLPSSLESGRKKESRATGANGARLDSPACAAGEYLLSNSGAGLPSMHSRRELRCALVGGDMGGAVYGSRVRRVQRLRAWRPGLVYRIPSYQTLRSVNVRAIHRVRSALNT